MNRPLSLLLYGAATGLLEPLAPAVLSGRARRGREDPARIGERLGRASQPRPPGDLVWLHGVSVGESLSLLPLVEALRQRRPDLALLVTTGTRTSADLLARRLPAGVVHQYAPVDAPGAVRRFLDHWRPAVGLFVESELWPNLILSARARGARLALVSARMTEASAAGWARRPAAARAVLGAFDLVLPQEPETAGRLAALGARVGPELNLKLAGTPPPHDPEDLARLKAAVGERPVVLAASTHAGEEALVAEAARLAAPQALLVVAPRHPDRGPEVAHLLSEAGWRVARRAAGDPLTAETNAYVADTLGEMGLFLRLADATVLGGAFQPGIGGHNPLEAARLGVAVITGPHAFNARAVFDALLDRGAAIEAADGAALTRRLAGLLANPMIARRMGEAALAFAQAQDATLDRALALILPLAPPP